MTPRQPVIAAIDRAISALAGLAEALEQDAAPAGQEADLAAAQASAANPYGPVRGPRIIPVKPHTYLNSLANLRDREHYTAASAAGVAGGVEPYSRCPGEMGFQCYRERGHGGAHHSRPLGETTSHFTAASAAGVAGGVEPQCRASWGAEGNWYACLLPRGHSGQHKNDVAGWDAAAPCPAQWGEPPETMLCSLPSGHDGNHATAERIEWGGRWETAEPGAKDGA